MTFEPKNAFMSGLRAEKSLQCRKLAIDRYDLLYIILCGAFELIMFYKGGAGKDFFSSQPCHYRLLIAVFGLI
jgi:hypothetical protein